MLAASAVQGPRSSVDYLQEKPLITLKLGPMSCCLSPHRALRLDKDDAP